MDELERAKLSTTAMRSELEGLICKGIVQLQSRENVNTNELKNLIQAYTVLTGGEAPSGDVFIIDDITDPRLKDI